MSILNFFKRKAKSDEIEEIVIERLGFSEIGEWINKKIKKNLEQESVALSLIKDRISDFASEIDIKIIALEKFDLNAKRESVRTKGIVSDSRNKYIAHIENLNKKFEKLKESELEKIIEKINNLLFDFNKRSFKDYERTTFLIGKEMVEIKENFKLFSADILKIFNENKYAIDSLNIISSIEKNIDAFSLLNETIASIEGDVNNTREDVKKKEKEKRDLEENLEEVKSSKAYLDNLDKQKDIKIFEEEIDKYISELKQLIDFKQLTNIFHISPKKMEIIKEYKEHFQIYFKKDKGTPLVEMLDETKLNNNTILEKIDKIKTKTEKMESTKKEIIEDKFRLINSKIRKIDLEIENIKIDITREEERIEKLTNNKEELFNLLKNELKKNNVDLNLEN